MRILIAAASPWVRAGMETLLRAEPEFQVLDSSDLSASQPALTIETAAHALVEESVALRPDLLLIDLEAMEEEILQSLALVAQSGVATVALLPFRGGHPTAATIAAALRAGIRALLPRDIAPAALISSLHAAYHGLVLLPSDQFPALLPARLQQEPAATDEPLTARELEILRMLAEGDGNKQIAARLGISEHTVKFHVASIMSKLHSGTRTEAVTRAIRKGMIPL